MAINILAHTANCLDSYGEIPISFTVRSLYRVEKAERRSGGWLLREEQLERSYVKDYDAGGERPLRWQEKWDLTDWLVLAASEGVTRLGGAVVAWNTPGVSLLEGRDDLAVLWDLRVHPNRRREGIGKRLFDYAAAWARARGCRQFKVETQNVNVPACKFYAKQGCYLGAVNPGAYSEFPDEVQLLWYLKL